MSISIGTGFSKNRDGYLAGREAAQIALRNLKGKSANIAFVFATVHFNLNKLLEGVKSVLGNIPLTGSSGAGVISNDNVENKGIVIMLVGSPTIKFSTACETDLDKKNLVLSGQALAGAALKKLGSINRETFIIFIDGLLKNSSNLILGLRQSLGTSLPLVGGSSADDLTFTKTFQFYNYEVLTNSVVGILVGQDAIIKIGIRHGWKPLGKPRIITKSSGNIIETIDDQPAIRIYEDYFGKDNQEIKSGRLILLSVRYPLGIRLEGEEEYLLRNAKSAGVDGSLICQADVPQGASIKLMMGTKESALKAASQAAEELKKPTGSHGHIKFALVFDSFSRNRLFGRSAKDEIEVIKNVLGKDIPFIGFYTYGEQAPLSALGYKGQSYFHNETIAILGIGEPI